MYGTENLAMLDAEEEKQHFQVLEAADYARRQNPDTLARADLMRHYATLEASERSFETLVRHNLRLVHKLVGSYRSPLDKDFDDLVQDAIVGLIEAVRRYEYKRGLRFSTYAYKCIKNSIVKALESKYSPTKLGDRTGRRLREVEKLRADMESSSGAAPDMSALRNASGLSDELFADIEPFLAAKLYEWDERELSEVAANLPRTDHVVESNTLRDAIAALVLGLPPKSQECILLRMGFEQGGAVLGWQEVANHLKMSRESVRIHINAGFALLRPLLIARGLHLLLEEIIDDNFDPTPASTAAYKPKGRA